MNNLRDRKITEEEFNRKFEVRHKYKDVQSKGIKFHIVVQCFIRSINVAREREDLHRMVELLCRL